MKNFLFCIIFLLVGGVKSQGNIKALNGYRYCLLEPVLYENGGSDIWGIRSNVRSYLLRSNISVVDVASQNLDQCLIVRCVIEHTYTPYASVADYVYVKFFNCMGEVVFQSQGSTGALVSTYRQGFRKATAQAMAPFNSFRHVFNPSITVEALIRQNMPKLELTGYSESDIKYLTDKPGQNQLVGLYKMSYAEGGVFYKLGIFQDGPVLKAVVVETNNRYWQIGEVKAIFESTSDPGFYTVTYFLDYKNNVETFAILDRGLILSIDLSVADGYDPIIKFYKYYP